MIYESREGKASTGGRFAPKTMLWWDYRQPNQDTLWKSWIELGEELFQEIVTHPMPIDMGILKALRRSSLGLDLYMWLSYKTFTLYRLKKKARASRVGAALSPVRRRFLPRRRQDDRPELPQGCVT
jgi:hypothetical protein